MYASVNDMVSRFGREEITRLSQIEDRETDEINNLKVERALLDATALIEGYLRGRYKLPVAEPKSDLIRATCIIARYDLAKTARSEPTEQMQKDYDAMLKWLLDIQKGTVIVDATMVGAGNGVNAYGARFEDRKPIFTPHTLRGA